MSRSRAGAWAALALLVASLSAAVLCGWVTCSELAMRAGCHPAPTSPRLADCCAAHSSSAVSAESLLAAVAAPRLAALIVPRAPDPASAAAAALDARDFAGRISPVPLFTLHRSLLL